MAGTQKGAAAGRRTLRDRKVSQRMSVVDESTRQQAAQARLDALENDHEPADAAFGGDSDDDEFNIEDDDDDEEIAVSGKRGRKKKAAGKRKLRGFGADKRGPKTFARVLEEAELDRLPPGVPSYLTAAAAPPKSRAALKFCSVCGNLSTYTCVRCGSKYCTKKCFAVHSETRCLKFTG